MNIPTATHPAPENATRFPVATPAVRGAAGPPVNVMLDLETLGTVPGSSLFEIGACVFDATGPHPDRNFRFHTHIRVSGQGPFGLKADTDTMLWWMHPDRAAAAAPIIAAQRDELTPCLERALEFFAAWLAGVAPDFKSRRIWGKGPSFDCGLLAAAYRATGIPVPWRYAGERDLRTLLELFPEVPEPERLGLHHTALGDALHQARHAGAILRHRATLGLSLRPVASEDFGPVAAGA